MFYIRADANETIGTGHVMRCLSIAEELRDMGETVTFLVADERSCQLINREKFPVVVLHTSWNHMDQELKKLGQLIEENQIERLLIDSYQVTEGYLTYLKEQVKTIYIDDTGQSYFPADALICYSNCWEEYQHQKKYPSAKLFLGPEYTPLRKGFRGCLAKDIKLDVEELLLVSGGTDNYHALKRILEKLPCSAYQRITVICGMFNVDYAELEEKYKDIENVFIHDAVPRLEPYLKRADLAVSAGGTTLCELCAMGTPTVSFSLADNQLASAEKYDADGIMEYAGDAREEKLAEKVVQILKKYYDNFELRMERSRKMQAFIDGYGAKRIAAELIKL